MNVLGYGFALSMLLAGMAQAHPHAFIDSAIEVIFDDQGRASGVRISWTYDDLTSLSVISDRGFDPDFDGVLTAAELAELSGFDMNWDAAFLGDTYALLGKVPLDLSRPSDWTVSYANAKLTSTHYRSFTLPVAIGPEPLVVQSYDPDYYTAYAMVGQALVNGRPGCSAQIYEPDQAAADSILQAAIDEMAGSTDVEGAFPAVGAAYAEEVRVTCNAPS